MYVDIFSDLSTKLQDTLELIEESLDVALSRTCHSFDPDLYLKVQAGYTMLGKTQTALDQLHMHFTTAVHVCHIHVSQLIFTDLRLCKIYAAKQLASSTVL